MGSKPLLFGTRVATTMTTTRPAQKHFQGDVSSEKLIFDKTYLKKTMVFQGFDILQDLLKSMFKGMSRAKSLLLIKSVEKQLFFNDVASLAILKVIQERPEKMSHNSSFDISFFRGCLRRNGSF